MKDRRRTILEAAARVIARRGVRGLRVEELAVEAGVSKALVYYHFEDRAGCCAARWSSSAPARSGTPAGIPRPRRARVRPCAIRAPPCAARAPSCPLRARPRTIPARPRTIPARARRAGNSAPPPRPRPGPARSRSRPARSRPGPARPGIGARGVGAAASAGAPGRPRDPGEQHRLGRAAGGAVFEPELREDLARVGVAWVREVADLLGQGSPAVPDKELVAAAERLTALLEGLSTRWLVGILPVGHARELMREAIAAEARRLDLPDRHAVCAAG